MKNTKAQGITSEDREQVRKANASYKTGDYLSSLDFFKRVNDRSLLETEEYLIKLGICYFNSPTERSKAIPLLEKALKSHPKSMAELYNYIGQSYQFNKKFAEAITAYEKSLEHIGKSSADKKMRMEVINSISTCYTARDFNDKPMNVKVYNLGSEVNSTYPDYGSILSVDGNKIYYNTLKPNPTLNSSELFEMIYAANVSIKDKGNSKPASTEALNNGRHEAILGFGENGTKRYVYDEGDIYQSKILKSGEWSVAKKLNFSINSLGDETSIALSEDGKTLYFASDRTGGLGGLDLYCSTLQANGSWGDAVNLGPTINTPQDDDAPFVSKDGKTLYFSSKGHLTMGGYDIFRVSKENGHWSLPVNMGSPINSVGNDNYFSLSGEGTGYISSDRKGGFGGLDLYKIVYEEINIASTEIKGTMYLSNSYMPLNGKLKVIDKLSGATTAEVQIEQGEFAYTVVPGKKYILNLSAENYLPETLELFVPFQQNNFTLYQNFKIENILSADNKNSIGQQLRMNYAFFDVEQFLDSKQSLENIYEIENAYAEVECAPKMFTEVRNHYMDKEIKDNAKLLMVAETNEK